MVGIILLAKDYNVNRGWQVNLASYLVEERKIVVHLPEIWRMSKVLNIDFVDAFTKIITHEVLHHVIMQEIPEKYIKMFDGQELIVNKLSGTGQLLLKYKAELVGDLLRDMKSINPAMLLLQNLSFILISFLLGVLLGYLI